MLSRISWNSQLTFDLALLDMQANAALDTGPWKMQPFTVQRVQFHFIVTPLTGIMSIRTQVFGIVDAVQRKLMRSTDIRRE
jgi:hypothetical protein